MTDKEVHVSGNGGAGLGLVAGILLATVAAILLIFFAGDFGGADKTVDINVEAPKMNAPTGGNAG